MNKTRGRPNLGKTKTTRERAVTVYLPTEDMVQEWKDEAEMRGIPLSRFVCEVVDESIRKGLKGVTPREELERERDAALAENKRLKDRVEQSESSLKQADVTVAKYRAKVSTARSASYDEKMMGKIAGLFLDGFFSGSPMIRLDEIPASIGVKPDDAKGITKIRDSLNFLSACGLIEEDMTEGRWKVGTGYKLAATGKNRGHERAH